MSRRTYTMAQVQAKARMAFKKRHEEVEAEELESGELNLVPYLDIVTNILLFLLASVSAGIIFGLVNTSLPDHAPSAGGVTNPNTNPNEQSLQLVVSVTKTEIKLWSISGLEGAINEPKVTLSRNPEGSDLPYDYYKLNDALAEIVKRRYADYVNCWRPYAPVKGDGENDRIAKLNAIYTECREKRAEATQQVILQADPTTPYEVIIQVMDYTREVQPKADDPSRADVGLGLFPTVHFSSGFE